MHISGMCLSVFPETFNSRAKVCPECGWNHPMGQEPGLNKVKEKGESQLSIVPSLSRMPGWCCGPSHSHNDTFPTTKDCAPIDCEPNQALPHLSCICQMTAMRKVTDRRGDADNSDVPKWRPNKLNIRGKANDLGLKKNIMNRGFCHLQQALGSKLRSGGSSAAVLRGS